MHWINNQLNEFFSLLNLLVIVRELFVSLLILSVFYKLLLITMNERCSRASGTPKQLEPFGELPI